MGRPDFTRLRILPRRPLLTSSACAGAKARQSQNVEDYRGRRTGLGWRRHEDRPRHHRHRCHRLFRWWPATRHEPAGRRRAQHRRPKPRCKPARHPMKPASSSRTCSATPKKPGTAIFTQGGQQYAAPNIALFDDGINTGCGSATSAAGPFYCPRRSAGVYRSHVLPAARNRVRRAGRLCQGLRHCARSRPSRAELVRRRRQGACGPAAVLGRRRQRAAGEDGAAGGLLRRHLGSPRGQHEPGGRGRRYRRSTGRGFGSGR